MLSRGATEFFCNSPKNISELQKFVDTSCNNVPTSSMSMFDFDQSMTKKKKKKKIDINMALKMKT